MAIVQRELKYEIASDGINPGSRVDAIISYNDSNPGAGPAFDSYNITAISGTYSTIDSNGNVIRTSSISGTSNYADASNVVYPSSVPYVDGFGISFIISNAADSNDGTGNVNFFYGSDVNGIDGYQEFGNNTNDASGVTFASVCFVIGTLIRTVSGDVPVETLSVGDLVLTHNGRRMPIRWIGHRTLACRGRQDTMPVRIAAQAFGERRPSRDLFVSPAHAIAVDVLGEVLIPACRLINGTTITQVDVGSVTYWHVELDSHDILLAENLPAESYLDCGNRRFFSNAEATDLLAAPDARPEGPLPFCRPFHEVGPVVDLVRARLQERAEALGWRKVENTFAGLHLVADGQEIRPDVEGLTARFVVPADARDVRLVSATSVPVHVVSGSSDDRRLGVALAALTIDDGLTGAREVALDDARLSEGLHSVDDGARWTDGSAVLPADLWNGCKGSFFLRVTLARPALARWVAPSETAGVVCLADRRKA